MAMMSGHPGEEMVSSLNMYMHYSLLLHAADDIVDQARGSLSALSFPVVAAAEGVVESGDQEGQGDTSPTAAGGVAAMHALVAAAPGTDGSVDQEDDKAEGMDGENPAADPEVATAAPKDDVSSMKVADLKTELRDRGLRPNGNEAELVERFREARTSQQRARLADATDARQAEPSRQVVGQQEDAEEHLRQCWPEDHRGASDRAHGQSYPGSMDSQEDEHQDQSSYLDHDTEHTGKSGTEQSGTEFAFGRASQPINNSRLRSLQLSPSRHVRIALRFLACTAAMGLSYWLLSSKIEHSKVLKVDCIPPCHDIGCQKQAATPDISQAMKEVNSRIRPFEIKFMFSPILPEISDAFFDSNKKLIVAVGPSSSGKTTMAHIILSHLSETKMNGNSEFYISEDEQNDRLRVIRGNDKRCQCQHQVSEGIMEHISAAWLREKGFFDSEGYSHANFIDVRVCHNGTTLDSLKDYVFIHSPGLTGSKQHEEKHLAKRKQFEQFWRAVLPRADMILVLFDQLAADPIASDSEFADIMQLSSALATRVWIGVNKAASNLCRNGQTSFHDECGKGFSKTIGQSGEVILPQNRLFREGILPQIQKHVFGGGVVPVDKLYFTNWGHDCREDTCASESCSCQFIADDERKLLREVMDRSAHKRNNLRATSLNTRWTLLDMHLRVMKKLQNNARLRERLQWVQNATPAVETHELQQEVKSVIDTSFKEVQCIVRPETNCCYSEEACPVHGAYRAFDVEDLAKYIVQKPTRFLQMETITMDDLKALRDAKVTLHKLLNVQCKEACSHSWILQRVTCKPTLLHHDSDEL
eukprot:TRINITY_DN2878_c0_g2_i3.p1 TRINITY_DN2878_c0_g2~~TRINITY_DN2878_c0_g2_i3.p1  ORF type:complete len:814 (-),score=112.10 TRINITY_DN2878_c0_g2_i3:64-2505(-)